MSLLRLLLAAALLASLSACTSFDPADAPAGKAELRVQVVASELRAQVVAAETALARSMAERNSAAFSALIADEAVFINGNEPLRGKAAVLAHWQRFFTGPQAPFSWQPEIVEVLPSGRLAQSTGPVYGADGKLIARYISVWRLEAPGQWRVVFDQGYDVCETAKL